MHETPINYADWDQHVPDYSFADDGFGTLVRTELDIFWFNVDRLMEDAH